MAKKVNKAYKSILKYNSIILFIILIIILTITISKEFQIDESNGFRTINSPYLPESSSEIKIFFDEDKTVQINIDGTNYPIKTINPNTTEVMFLLYNSRINLVSKSAWKINEKPPDRYFELMINSESNDFTSSNKINDISMGGDYFDVTFNVGSPEIVHKSVTINGEDIKSKADLKTTYFDSKYFSELVPVGERKIFYGPAIGITHISELPKDNQKLSAINFSSEMFIKDGGPLIIYRDAKWFPFDGFEFDGLFVISGEQRVDLAIEYPDNFYSNQHEVNIYTNKYFPFQYEREMKSVWLDSKSGRWEDVIKNDQKIQVHISFSRFGTLFNYLFLITLSLLGFLFSFRDEKLIEKFTHFIEFLILTVILVFIGLGRPIVILTLQELFCSVGFLIGLSIYYYRKNEILKTKVVLFIAIFLGFVWALM